MADNSRKALNVELARGCSGGCAFCGCFSFWCGQHRYFDIDIMCDHIQHLVDRYGITHIYLSDDNFTSNKVMVEKVCNEFMDRNWDLTWDTRGRVNDMDPDLLKKMKQAGCSEILIGIESSDDLILENMNKRVLSHQQYQAVVNIMEAEILPILSLILGYEGETERSINKTIAFLLKLYRIEKPMVAYFHICSIVPGTKLYNKNVDLLLEQGIEIIEELKYGGKKISCVEKNMLKKYPTLFSTFYHMCSNVEFRILRTISKLATIVLPVFRFTLSMIEKSYGNILSLFQRYSDQYRCNIEMSEIVRGFSAVIMEKFGHDIKVKNMMIFENLIYRLSSTNVNKVIYITFDLDIMKLKAMIKHDEVSEIDLQKHDYKVVSQNKKIHLYSVSGQVTV